MRTRFLRLAWIAAACGLSVLAALAHARESRPEREPERPRLSVDTLYTAPPGRRLTVRAGSDLQAALDAARPGDLISLEPGATYRGPFTLHDKAGAGWIIVRTGAGDGGLPPAGRRIDRSDARVMAKLEAASESVLRTAPGAHHYRFVEIEIRPAPGTFLYNLVLLGGQERSLDQMPHHIIFERCYIHGDPAKGSRRGIALNAAHLAVIDSHLSEFKEVDADSQAIAGWAGPGPFKIANNHLEAAGENVMFGGADPLVRNLVPSDIEIRGNHFSKPLSWKIGEPSYEGTPWSVKNLLELKNARRVLIEGNLLERNWVHAQNGFAVLLTVRNQDGKAPWSVVEDVTFTRNIVRQSAAGINILGRDDSWPSGSQPSRRIAIRDNLFTEIGDPRWGGAGTLFQMLEGVADVSIESNTAFQTGNIIMAEGSPHTGFIYRDNVSRHNAYGVSGTGSGTGRSTLKTYFPGAVMERNVMAGGRAADYPPGNLFPSSLEKAGFAPVPAAALCEAMSPADRPRSRCDPRQSIGRAR